jgi:hypothetical protein
VVIGPPAPCRRSGDSRPTPEELAQVSAAFQKFVASDKSSVAPLLRKFSRSCFFKAARDNAATYTNDQRQGRAMKGSWNAQNKATSTCCCTATRSRMVGQGDLNKAVFGKYFGQYARPISGWRRHTDVLWGLKNGEGQVFNPKPSC